MKKFYYILFLLLPALCFVGCSDEGMFSSDDEEYATLRYVVSMDQDIKSRAIGDGNQVDTLKVLIFQDTTLVKTEGFERNKETGTFSVELTLLNTPTYKLVFWADKKNNGIYSIDGNGNLTIDYSKYSNLSLAGTEAFEAFYARKEVCIKNGQNVSGEISLTRPFSQLNIAAKEEDVFNKAKTASLTIDQLYTSFSLLDGSHTGEASEATLSFQYSEGNLANKQSIQIGDDNYYYVASAYLLAPKKVNITGGLYGESNTTLKEFDFRQVSLATNYRTNIYGEMIQVEELAAWDGVIPSVSPLTQDAENRYIIDEEADLAWLSVAANTATLSENSTFIVTKDVLNMGSKEISSIHLPKSSTFNGSKKTIQNFANSLFGEATNLTVKNLIVENVTATAKAHVGVLVNTLKGNSSFEGITIKNSSATTTNGAAGGMIGYIVRTDEKDRNETLSVSFTGCHVKNTTISSDNAEGKFVGLLSGYDNGETLSFDEECSAQDNTTDYNSLYTTDNQSVWAMKDAEGNDITIDNKYDGWLGNETYHRGIVKFANKRLVPKWDGETTVEPIYEDTAKKIAHIWSPFDLAYLGGKTLTTLYFKTDVDMAGVCDKCNDGKGNSTIANDDLSTCTKCKAFTPIIQLNNLYGENHTLYNLFVQGEHEADGSYNDGMGFIRHTNSGTFKDFTFDGAIIKCIDDKDYRNDDQKGGNGYAGTLTSRVAEKMTISNVHARNGRVIAISKFGGLIGYVPGGIDATNCTVDNYIIENHKINVNNSYSTTVEKTLLEQTIKAECSENFYTEGEAGGFIGFINSTSTITDCKTSNITMKCYGIEDRDTKIKTYILKQDKEWVQTGKWPWQGEYQPVGDPYWKHTGMDLNYTIAGRHVNTFIGDIRTPNSNTVVINQCSTSGNCADGYDYNITKAGKGELVGCCYFVGKDIEVLGKSMHAGDYKGTVTIDGESMPFVGG